MTLDSETTTPRRRSTNPDTRALLQAREILAPFQEQIGPWQQRLAFLRTTRALRSEYDIRSEAAELLPLVTAARTELEADLVEVRNEAVARHSLIASVRASLERLRIDLEGLRFA